MELKTLFQVCLTITEKNVVAVVVVVDGGGGGKKNNRNVVMVVVVVVVFGGENNRILWPENLYKCVTFYLFLSLHFAPEELTWVGSVLSAKSPLVERKYEKAHDV